MKVFDIITVYTSSQTHSVVAHDMGIAERLFLERYPGTKIQSIKLHSEYVIVQKQMQHHIPDDELNSVFGKE